ncbi:MAG: hypothetical protein EPN55_05375, partial [Gammaproteobacteria bacterium]
RDAAWGEVARRMAHEIKNPLTPIQLSAERIRHKFLKRVPEEERETLDRATRTIVEQVEALKSLVNAFSDLARGGMRSGPVKLNELIRDVVELYRSEAVVEEVAARAKKPKGEVVPLRGTEAKGKPLTLALELEPRLPVITADAGRLRQVLHNLLLNARDALAGRPRPRPRVRLHTHALTEKDAHFIEFRIEDNGPGFPEAMLGRLFEPYVTTKDKGTGLGLAVVKRIVEEHGGSISAGNLPDGGAGVTIRLPVAQAGSQPAPAPAEARK